MPVIFDDYMTKKWSLFSITRGTFYIYHDIQKTYII